MVRDSDLTGIDELLPGAHRKLHAWPPENLAPGVVLRRRNVTIRDPKTQEPKETRSYLEPVVEDTRMYYWNLAQHDHRPEDDVLCAVCRGAGYVRRGELVPGRPGFGGFMICPNYVVGDENQRGACRLL